MKKNPMQPQLPVGFSHSRPPGFFRWWGVIMLCGWLSCCACGRLQPQPARFDPQVYTSIEYRDLLTPGPAGLHAGQKIRVKAYFWQYLDYDPAMIPNYLTLARYPIRWYQLRWFATYDTDRMTGYYDRVALSPELAAHYRLNRLDPVLLYGELSSLGPGLYLQVFHIEKIAED
jgi:hypothetical protein